MAHLWATCLRRIVLSRRTREQSDPRPFALAHSIGILHLWADSLSVAHESYDLAICASVRYNGGNKRH
jgi:hypothetical protein